MAEVEIIIGPMFGGKTSELLSRLSIYQSQGKNCYLFSHSFDIRSHSEIISTHNPILKQSTDTIINKQKISELPSLSALEHMINFDGCDIIAIDEAQFFVGLKKFIKNVDTVLEYKKYPNSSLNPDTTTVGLPERNATILISGLISDSNMEKFGEIVDLFPLASKITQKRSFCYQCLKKGIRQKASFTKKIISKSANDETQIEIGGKEIYQPCCRKCFSK